MSTLRHGVLENWIVPGVMASGMVAGAAIEQPADHVRLPKPRDGKAKLPFAWVYFGAPAEIVQRELNGSVFERVFPWVDVVFAIPGRGDTQLDEMGSEIGNAVHVAVFEPFRNDPASLPPSIKDADLLDLEIHPTPDGKNAVARLTYDVLMRRSVFDLAEQTAA